MAFAIPETEPTTVTAGDRLQWKRTDLSDFPADEWTLTYYLRGNKAGAQQDVEATADGDEFEIDVAPSVSAAWVADVYYWSAFVEKNDETDRKLIGQGRLVVKENPVDVVQPTDGRSHARRTLEAIEAVIEQRATTDQQRYVLQAVGRSVDRMPIADLLKFRDYYAGLVAQEDAAANGGAGRNIKIRFNL